MRKRLVPIQSLHSPIHGMISLVSKHRLFEKVLIPIGVSDLGTVSRNLQSKRTFMLPLLLFLAGATALPSAAQSSSNDVPVLQQSQLVYRRLHARFIETCDTMSRRIVPYAVIGLRWPMARCSISTSCLPLAGTTSNVMVVLHAVDNAHFCVMSDNPA